MVYSLKIDLIVALVNKIVKCKRVKKTIFLWLNYLAYILLSKKKIKKNDFL